MISIIIPIYNQADKLPKCLDSILNQTLIQTVENQYLDTPKYQSEGTAVLEVILVDDGSTDNSQEVARIYKEKFQKAGIDYKVLQHEKNQGAPVVRNTGFKNSSGEYLFFCDADAVLKFNALEIMLASFKKHPEASYVYPSFYWGRKIFRVGEWSKEKLKAGPCIHTMALIRRDDFPKAGWDESIKKFQDWDIWLTMMEAGKRGQWINNALFTVSPGGTMSGWLPSFAYKLFPFLPVVRKYNQAMEVIRQKHHL